MLINEIKEELQNCIALIEHDGKDWLDKRDIPMLQDTVSVLEKYQQIEAIVNSPVYIQEDVIRYKMICEVLGAPRP